MKRYSAKLLFQFRVETASGPGVRRLCEERIVLLEASSGRKALQAANKIGRQSRLAYKNCDSNDVHFEFIGVLDLLELGVGCEPNEVWYDIVERVRPMERRRELLPPVKELQAIRADRERREAKARKQAHARRKKRPK